jgi:hypothetical protein
MAGQNPLRKDQRAGSTATRPAAVSKARDIASRASPSRANSNGSRRTSALLSHPRPNADREQEP